MTRAELAADALTLLTKLTDYFNQPLNLDAVEDRSEFAKANEEFAEIYVSLSRKRFDLERIRLGIPSYEPLDTL
jgi:hypothetical protein